MSPTKHRAASTTSRVLTRAASSIPRRTTTTTKTTRSKTTSSDTTTKTTKTTKTTNKSKAPTTRRKQHESVLNNPSNAANSNNIFSNAARNQSLSDDKENMPTSGTTRVLRSRVRPVSPTKGKTGVCKPSPATTRTRSSRRVPLRELSDHEIFERDAATLGDLRRRRSGEHSGTYIEFETNHAPDVERAVPTVVIETTRASTTVVSEPIAPAEPVEMEPLPAVTRAKEKIQVLRRTSSVENLQRKVEAIMAATATTNNIKATTKKRPALRSKAVATPQKHHPAVRKASPGLDSPDPFANSPILAPRTISPISKAPASPPRPARIGLGPKNVNVVLMEATKAGKPEAATIKKPILTASNAPTTRGTAAKKPAFNSLRRAAGSSARLRPTPANTVNSARTGLDAIRRMR
ncbi:hypothetical protein EX30DRAFT_348213 [Ascodesmis nigricans]|uniref:Uncharacterized protein n=1 Tax=Ascodesmis nigricans TaxID=341454 RepID=A0A4S2MYL8_9PEZI|nr:hypothetical protein EX30DRAFT_348213 [Ascodesmis nigricans]